MPMTSTISAPQHGSESHHHYPFTSSQRPFLWDSRSDQGAFQSYATIPLLLSITLMRLAPAIIFTKAALGLAILAPRKTRRNEYKIALLRCGRRHILRCNRTSLSSIRTFRPAFLFQFAVSFSRHSPIFALDRLLDRRQFRIRRLDHKSQSI